MSSNKNNNLKIRKEIQVNMQCHAIIDINLFITINKKRNYIIILNPFYFCFHKK
jgi:hypothetical protein